MRYQDDLDDRKDFLENWKDQAARAKEKVQEQAKLKAKMIKPNKPEITTDFSASVISKALAPHTENHLCEEICKRVRLGVRPSVAALAEGLDPVTFRQMCTANAADLDGDLVGDNQSPNPVIRDLVKEVGMKSNADFRLSPFAVKVAVAWAQARSAAEERTFAERPLDWLRQGPGRTKRSDAIHMLDEADNWTQPEEELKAMAGRRGEEKIEITYINELNLNGDDDRVIDV